MNTFKQFLKIVFSIILISATSVIHGQVFHSGRPLYNPSADSLIVPEIIIQVDKIPETKFSSEGIMFKSDVFAISVDLNITPEEYGAWYTFPEQNKKVWLCALKASDAKSLNLILNPFNLKPGAKLFFYDSLQSQILGAITCLNNKQSDILPLSIIKGDKIYCELQIPVYTNDYGYLTISKAGIESKLAESFKTITDQYYHTSAECNVNVNCKKDENIQLQKKSSCRIIYKGSARCTGTLINNIENDGTPYVLTAAHCINTQYAANTAVFYFNYESPDCENIDGPLQTISGSTLIAAGYHNPSDPDGDTLDFALLKLSEKVPLNYYPYFSGWDATGIPPDSTYILHHPKGDIKKITFDSHVPTTISCLGFNSNTHWYLLDYDYGTTEEGSSGGGLINQDNNLIGTLTGGEPYPCLTQMMDFYQMFAHSYNDYDDGIHELKKWLDPKQSNKLICNSYDAAGAFRETAQSLKNYSDDDSLLVVKQTEGWGYLSGHNYQQNYLFAEHFTIDGSKYLYGAYVSPLIAYSTNTSQMVNFFIRKGGSVPGEVVYEKAAGIGEMDPKYPFYIDFDSTILVSKDFYFGYQIGYSTDTFAVYTYNKSSIENSAFTFINEEWKPLQLNGESYSSSLAIEMLAFDLMPDKGVIIDTSEWDNISVYPNPAHEQVQIYFKELISSEITVSLYNISGVIVKTQKYNGTDPNIPIILNVPVGLYFLQVQSESIKPKTFKILVQ